MFKEKEVQWYMPENLTPKEQCPCCDHISLAERGNYLICPIRFWADDGQGLDELDTEPDPNLSITLRQGRQNFREFGACDPEMKKRKRRNFQHKPRAL